MILVINGPNLNLLGERKSKHYGDRSLGEINNSLEDLGEELGYRLLFFQSNHEGGIIDFIHEKRKSAAGVLINPGALTHYSYALRDALELLEVPVVEVHLSDVDSREKFRSRSVIEPVADERIAGKGEEGYSLGLKFIAETLD